MKKDNYVIINAVGDIMLGDHPMCIGHGVGSTLRKNNFKSPFIHVSDVLKKGDIVFGNLECVLSDIGVDHNSLKSIQLRGEERSISARVDAEFNVVSLANNHILEHGESSLHRTKEILLDNGIQPVGVSHNKTLSRMPVIFNIRGLRIGFLAYCLITDKTAYCSIEDSKDIINDIKKTSPNVDILIVSMHWGVEYMHIPSPKQRELAHEIIDAGAKIILGHHPHVLQGVEQYNGGVIAYSLGNFVFDMWQRKTRESMIFSCYISKEGISNYEVIPVLIGKDFAPRQLEGHDKEKLIKLINEGYLIFLEENKYHETACMCRKKYRIDLFKYTLRYFYLYNPKLFIQILINTIKKRI